MSNLRYTYCFRTGQNQDAARPTRFPDHGASRKGQSRAACSLVSLPTFRRYQGTAEDHGQDCGAIQKVRRHDSGPRSEEHTSELQSRLHLVCRLLLEKKKKDKLTISYPTTTHISQRTLLSSLDQSYSCSILPPRNTYHNDPPTTTDARAKLYRCSDVR